MLLVTRPQPNAAETARRLKRQGHKTVVAPQLQVTLRLPRKVDISATQALIVTSPQAAQALRTWTYLHVLPVYAVGDKTAALLKKNGFKKIYSANGDAADLLKLINKKCPKRSGKLMLAVAPNTGRKLASDLNSLGYKAQRISVYDIHMLMRLSSTAQEFLARKAAHGVLLYSPRTARAFVAAVRDARLKDCTVRLNAYCISGAVAKAAQQLPWRHVYSAVKPNEDALFALLPKRGNK